MGNWIILPLGGTREYFNINMKHHFNWNSLKADVATKLKKTVIFAMHMSTSIIWL